MNLRFRCPSCQQPVRIAGANVKGWKCPGCGGLPAEPAPVGDGALPVCAVCGNAELYRKKDFPHWLGLSILAVACVAFLTANWVYHQWWGWVILIGSAIFDGLLYLWVGDVVVCYRCGAEYRGLPADPSHKPFDLGTAERYRQERLRREQLQLQEKNAGGLPREPGGDSV